MAFLGNMDPKKRRLVIAALIGVGLAAVVMIRRGSTGAASSTGDLAADGPAGTATFADNGQALGSLGTDITNLTGTIAENTAAVNDLLNKPPADTTAATIAASDPVVAAQADASPIADVTAQAAASPIAAAVARSSAIQRPSVTSTGTAIGSAGAGIRAVAKSGKVTARATTTKKTATPTKHAATQKAPVHKSTQPVHAPSHPTGGSRTPAKAKAKLPAHATKPAVKRPAVQKPKPTASGGIGSKGNAHKPAPKHTTTPSSGPKGNTGSAGPKSPPKKPTKPKAKK